MRLISLFGLLAMLLGGCGIAIPDEGTVAEPFWLDGKGSDTSSDAGNGLDSGGAGGTDSVLPASDTTGTILQGPTSEYFAFWTESRVLSHNPSPIGAAWQPSRTTTIGLMRVDWLGNHGQAWQIPCAVHSNEVASSQLTYPTNFINALAEGPYAIERAGGTLKVAGKMQWVGLKKGYMGDLPDPGDGNHPALTDDDDDGHPGVTIFINMPFFGDQAIYVAERATTSWSAERAADGSIVALPLTVGAKITVGATESILIAPENNKPLDGEAPEELRLTPTNAATSCAALLAAPDAYTGMSWPP